MCDTMSVAPGKLQALQNERKQCSGDCQVVGGGGCPRKQALKPNTTPSLSGVRFEGSVSAATSKVANSSASVKGKA